MDENNRGNTEQVFGEKSAETGVDFQAQADRAEKAEAGMVVEAGNAGAARPEEVKFETGAAKAEGAAAKPGMKASISEEQARVLLMQEKVETEQRMKNVSTHRKKVLTLVIGAAAFLAVVAVVMWLVVGNRTGESGAANNRGGSVISSGAS